MNSRIIIIMVLALGLTGCGAMIKSALTKDPAACASFVPGKTTEMEVSELIGRPVGVKKNIEGKVAKYRAGYFTASVSYDDKNIVKEFECNR